MLVGRLTTSNVAFAVVPPTIVSDVRLAHSLVNDCNHGAPKAGTTRRSKGVVGLEANNLPVVVRGAQPGPQASPFGSSHRGSAVDGKESQGRSGGVRQCRPFRLWSHAAALQPGRASETPQGDDRAG